MEKIEKDGNIAVLISPGWGQGWSTAADEDSQRAVLCMDARIVGAFLVGGSEAAVAAAEAMFPYFSTGGAEDLCIEWVPKGTVFEVTEHDGNEQLRYLYCDRAYLVA